MNNPRTVLFGAEPLRLEDVVDLAEGRAKAALNPDAAFAARITKGAEFLDRLLEEDGVIYGVTTGYGDSCTVTVPSSLVQQLPHQLYTFHGVGLGAIFDAEAARAILAVRLTSLCRGYSGVSLGLLKQLEQLIIHDILPAIPEEGSVGASGDLTPLSYIAAVLCGEREVLSARMA